MSLIVEDGTGLPNSESYCSVAFADQYWANQNNTDWAALDTATKEGALRRASSYLIGHYRLRWKGRRVLITQAMDWPRVGVVLTDFGGSQGRTSYGSYGLFQVSYTIVPNEMQVATAELAMKTLTYDQPLSPDLSQMITSEQTGPVKVTYNEFSQESPRYRFIESLIKVFLLDNGSEGSIGVLWRT